MSLTLNISISLPYLWGNQVFQKNEWGFINFLVGPNGTGKSLFAEQLKQQCSHQGLKPRYLNAERLTGLERQHYDLFGYSQLQRGFDIGQFQRYKANGMNYGISTDAFITIKEKLDVKIRIEASLSQLFRRRIRLAEEGGFLNPKVQKIHGGDEYGLREGECHGLKELIALLTFLYDDEYNCLIIDEPELHLHPQFQTLLLQELRQMAGDPKINTRKKCFFLITHSPYYVDIRTVEDLKHCVVFQPEKCPTYVDHLESDDEWKLRRLLPRLNTHHKQFFFASRPIFVEGYFDQQVFTLIQEKRGKLLGASGACIIDVGGKEELDLFFRLCNKLNIDAQFIADLDALFQGNLRQSVSKDNRCNSYLHREGLGLDLLRVIGEVEQEISRLLKELELELGKIPNNTDLQALHKALTEVREEDRDRDTKKRYIFLMSLKYEKEKVVNLLYSFSVKFNFIEGRLTKIIDAFKESNVYLLPKGELENYLPSFKGNLYKIQDKEKQEVFEQEKAFLLENDLTEEEFHNRYGELITILDAVSQSSSINMDLHLSYAIGDWIHKVQSAFVRGEIIDEKSLEKITTVEWKSHSRIFDLVKFSQREQKEFTCIIKLKPLVDLQEREVEFNNTTVPASFKLLAAYT